MHKDPTKKPISKSLSNTTRDQESSAEAQKQYTSETKLKATGKPKSPHHSKYYQQQQPINQ